MERIFGWGGLSVLLIAAAVMFRPSAVDAQVTDYSATRHSDVTVLPAEDYAIPIPNRLVLFAYDFTRKSARDFVPFAQNLGFNVQVVGNLTGSGWSLSVYIPGNTNPVMEVSAKARISALQGSSSRPLMCAWGPNKTATVLFFESDTPDALFPDNNSDCGPGIFVQVSSQPGPDGAQPFSAFPDSQILQNAQDAVKYLNSQLSGIPGAPPFIFAPPPSPLCTTITIVPASLDLALDNGDAEELNVRTTTKDFQTGPTHGIIKFRNDLGSHPEGDFGGPILEHELLHALGIGHTGQALGHAPKYSSTDIMSLTASGVSPSGMLTTTFLPLTADEKQAVAELYGSATITLSASQRQKFCRVYDPTAATAAVGGGGGGGTGTGSGLGSCSLSCSFPQVLEPNSCSCVCQLTASSCFPNFVDAQNCQCYSVTHSLCFNSCPQGSFADPSVNCQCVPEIGPQGGGSGCDPSKDTTGLAEGNGIQCGN